MTSDWRRRGAGRPKKQSQRGVAALEFAFVLPILILVMGGTFSFSLAFIARQLLGNIATDTARACVLRSASGPGGVQSCGYALGAHLAATQPGICGPHNPVSFMVATQPLPQHGFGPTAKNPAQEYLLVVTASCQFTLLASLGSIVHGGSAAQMPGFLQGVSAMPFTVSGGA